MFERRVQPPFFVLTSKAFAFTLHPSLFTKGLMLERLQKILSRAGLSSRRESEGMITSGRVAVNGQVVTELGTKADPGKDRITLDGRPVLVKEERLYILLYKPAGYVTTLKDPDGRPVVTSLLKGITERVYPVGRLDYNTEGLLLLTNDGDWANGLAHPRHEVEKEYLVKIRGKASREQIQLLANGVDLEEGTTAPAKVTLAHETEKNCHLSITIHEGRYRQVRRMCEAVSLSVAALKRVRYGFLQLDSLRPGEFRFLATDEVQMLAAPHSNKKSVAGSVPVDPAPERTSFRSVRDKKQLT